MIRITRFLLLLLLVGVTMQSAIGQTFTLSFANATIISGSPDKLQFEVWLKSSVAASLGTDNILFTYNTAGFGTNATASITPVNYSGGGYGAMTLTNLNTSTKSINIFLNNPSTLSTAVATAGSGTQVCTIQMNITSTVVTSNLAFNLGTSVLYLDDEATEVTSKLSGGGLNVALPVELVNFTALARGRNIDLSWSTKTESNNYGFDVERLNASSTWDKVGFVEGKGTTSTPQSYSYKDVVKSAGTVTYRLKQTDRDGKFTYSSQVEAKATLSPEDYKLSQNYPNPFNQSTKFNFAVQTPQQVTVRVFNNIGQEVKTLFNGVAQADQVYDVTFDGANLSSGTYYYVLKAKDRFEVKKMIMMK